MASMQPLVFFGTPEFAVPTLRALAATELRPALDAAVSAKVQAVLA